MVNHNHKFVFIHVPKTGGTSIEHRIDIDIHNSDNKFILNGWDENLGKWLHHLTFEEVITSFPHLSDYFYFAFVRNPWDRCISSFFYSQRRQRPKGSLKDFLLFHNFKDKSHSISQYDFIFNNQNSKQIDFIGRFENLQKDFDIVCNKVNLSPQKLPIKNKSQYKDYHYTEYYDSETRKIVAEKYAKDIEYFGYKFGE